MESETECQSFMDRLASRYPEESEKQLHEREMALFLQWYQLHAISLQKAAVAAVLDNIHHLPDFPDLTGWIFGIVLRPCMISGNDIDASTAFCVDLARLACANNIQQKWALNIGLVGGDSSWQDKWQRWAVDNDATQNLVTAIPMTVMFHNCIKMASVPIFEPSYGAQAVLGLRALDSVDHLKRWIPTLKAMVLRGHVLGPPIARPDEDVGIRVGNAQNLGTEWAWVPLTDEEAEQAGYLEFPGVVGSIMQVSG
ncbi:hypothetical protein EVG20_g6747 [Dentipellis fragilis]|uniref:Uncharacterized protein n=1 Tax=Dentipellis fragilis TaxID=205917 RepID=A0A4Y9YKU1_9AGAM|nr:hypothetical protein EVG20_g6747 [Dentipellis fragilis]